MKKAVVLSLSNDKINLINEGEITALIKKRKPDLDDPFVCYVYSKEDENLVCKFNVLLEKYDPARTGILYLDKSRFELICINYALLQLDEICRFLRDGAYVWSIQANSVEFFEPVSLKGAQFNWDGWGYVGASDDGCTALQSVMTYEDWIIYKGSDGKYYTYDPEKYGKELKEVYVYQQRDNHHEWNLFQQKTPVSFGGDYDGETDDAKYLLSFKLMGE